MTRWMFSRLGVMLPFVVALLIAAMLPGASMARPPRLNASSCQLDGYLNLTDQLGTVSPFKSERECLRYVRKGGDLYSTPQAWWSQWKDGSEPVWCHNTINVANLDPTAVYKVHVVIDPLTGMATHVDQSFTLVFRADGTAYISVPYEECGGAPYAVYAEVFDSGGNLLTTAEDKLFA